MQKLFKKSDPILACVLAGILSISPAYADKPDWVGGGNQGKREHKENRDSHERERDGDTRHSHSDIQINTYFNDHQREATHT